MADPLTIAPFNWRDQIVVDVDGIVEEPIREAFLGENDYSLATYFNQVTFGHVNLRTGARVLRSAQLDLDHGLVTALNGSVGSSVERVPLYQAAVRWFLTRYPEAPIFGAPIDLPSGATPGSPVPALGLPAGPPAPPWVIFMLNPPSPAGGLTEHGACVLDWHATWDYLAHELAHALGWVHSKGVTGDRILDYEDPYCIMSAQGYAGKNPTHRRARPPGSRIPGNHSDPGRSFWGGGFGPMPAAATLYRELPAFRSSSMVVRVRPDQRVTLRALSEARRGEPVLAVMEYADELWMAELRVATNWDRGLVGNANSPGEGLAVHSWRPGSPQGAVYLGRVALPEPPWVSFDFPDAARMRLTVDHYDHSAKTAQVRFTGEDPFAPLGFDIACAPALRQVTLERAYDQVSSGTSRFQVAVTGGDGQRRTGFSRPPRPDPGTGGVTMLADVCRDGRVTGEWTIGLAKLDFGFGPSFMFRVEGSGLELAGALRSVGQSWQAEVDGVSLEFTGWQTPAIH